MVAPRDGVFAISATLAGFVLKPRTYLEEHQIYTAEKSVFFDVVQFVVWESGEKMIVKEGCALLFRGL